MLIGAGKQVTVRGALIAEGSAPRRIGIHALDVTGPFGNIRTLSPGTIRLAHVWIYGGLPLATLPYLAGTLEINGDARRPTRSIWPASSRQAASARAAECLPSRRSLPAVSAPLHHR